MIKKYLRISVVLAAVCVMVCCQKKSNMNNEVIESLPPFLEPHTITVNNTIKGYYSATPVHYATTSIKYPLLVFLHGGGQFGNGASDLQKVLNDGIPKLLRDKAFPPNFTVNGVNYSFVVAAPQFTQYPSVYEAETFINYAISHYRVDPARVYVVGMSVGGVVASDIGADFTSHVAAVISISGVSDTYDTSITTKCKKIAAGKLPVWVFQNEGDQVSNMDKAINFISIIKSFSPAIVPKYTQFTPQGYMNSDAWTRATDSSFRENKMNIYEWMLQYKR